MNRRLSTLATIALAAFVTPPANAALGPVKIDSGILDGVPALTANVTAYKGIP